MKDRFGREIDYLRISITDRCDLRCIYCRADCEFPNLAHGDVLRYEEILRLCRIALGLGVSNFKLTGGEPFVRKGAADFAARLKSEPGVGSVTLTTNGTHLARELPRLKEAGIDGVNVSLDAVEPEVYASITGTDLADEVISAIGLCADSGIRTKVNCVMLRSNEGQLIQLTALARDRPVDLRFIELMPIGSGRGLEGPDCFEALERLERAYPDLRRSDEKRGNGPAVYYESSRLMGRIGLIGANSHKFCAACNRVRLSSTGQLKPCLCYEEAVDLRTPLRSGASDEELTAALAAAIYGKPSDHCFSESEKVTECRMMSQIGG